MVSPTGQLALGTHWVSLLYVEAGILGGPSWPPDIYKDSGVLNPDPHVCIGSVSINKSFSQ